MNFNPLNKSIVVTDNIIKMSSTNVNVSTNKAVKATGKKAVKAEGKKVVKTLEIEPEVVDEEEEIEAEKKYLAMRAAALEAKIAQKALANKLPELVKEYIAERKADRVDIQAKIDDFKAKIAELEDEQVDNEDWLEQAENGDADKMILERAVAKLAQQALKNPAKTKTKTGKTVIPIKSGEERAEAVMGKGVMREGKLKSLIKSKGESVRWVSKGSKGVEYGVYKGDICSRDKSQVVNVFLMPIWADLVKELGFEKGMTLALFKQQLNTQ